MNDLSKALAQLEDSLNVKKHVTRSVEQRDVAVDRGVAVDRAMVRLRDGLIRARPYPTKGTRFLASLMADALLFTYPDRVISLRNLEPFRRGVAALKEGEVSKDLFGDIRKALVLAGYSVARADEVPIHMGKVDSVKLDYGTLVVTFDGGGITAMGCPDWFREMDDEAREQWKQVEGGLYWAEVDQTLRLRAPTVDPVRLAEVLKELSEGP